MKQPNFTECILDNDLVKRLKRIDVAAVSVASGGAMGTPVEVVVFFAGDDCIVEAIGNYIYGDLDLDVLFQKLRLDSSGSKSWTEHDLGMGNTLFVNARDYDALDFNLRADSDNVGEIYRLETWIILSAMHGIEDELRSQIYKEIFAEGGEVQVHSDLATSIHSDFVEAKAENDDDLLDYYGRWPICVFIDIGRELTTEEVNLGLSKMLPDGKRIYDEAMRMTPDELCVEKKIWLDRVIRVKKETFPKLIELWYSAPQSPYAQPY